MGKPILITGADRSVGSEVVTQLAATGAYVRAAVEDVDQARRMGWHGVEIVSFDYDDPATFEGIFADVARLLLVMPPGDFVTEENTIPHLIDAAHTAGVEHIVFISAMGTENIYFSSQWLVEKHLMAADVVYTILRSGWFFQNFITNDILREDIRQGALRLSIGDAKVSLVDVRDVAAVAVVALTEDGHRNQIYSLGEHLLSPRELADVFSKALGRPVVYVPITDQEAERIAKAAGMPRREIKWWRIVYQLMRQGAYASTVPDVSRVLGRPSITFKQFVQDYAEVWQ